MSKEKMSIENLGREYEKHARLQDCFIEKCKARINQAKQSGDMDAVQELQSDLYKFYEIKRELQETALHLKKYYKGET